MKLKPANHKQPQPHTPKKMARYLVDHSKILFFQGIRLEERRLSCGRLWMTSFSGISNPVGRFSKLGTNKHKQITRMGHFFLEYHGFRCFCEFLRCSHISFLPVWIVIGPVFWGLHVPCETIPVPFGFEGKKKASTGIIGQILR